MKKDKSKNRKTYMIPVFLIIIVVIISIAIPIVNNKNEVDPIEITKQNNGLPKLENFETLFNIAKENKNNYSLVKGETIARATTNAEDAETNTEGTNDYSKTNTQVEGVDEADIVKTDGKYIYYIANNKVVIVDTEEMKLISEIDYNNNERIMLQELYITENKLVTIGYVYTFGYRKMPIGSDSEEDVNTKYNNMTVARIYNIENREEPTLEREVAIEGYYLSSRMINSNLYFLANKYIYLYVDEEDEVDEYDGETYTTCYLDSCIGDKKTIDYKDIYYFPDSPEMSYLNIASLDINEEKEANIQTYLGAGEDIYMSANNLYVANVNYNYKNTMAFGYIDNIDVDTYIYKFTLNNTNVEYKSTGTAPGEILNQFSMDEKDGNFRIATTDYTTNDEVTTTNNLYVFDENMQMIGKLENLAKGENIYSVRFMGNRAYMVTFVQTDPLFVIDLEDPTNPYVLGELKIPGFSNYLHPYDETHIIGFGQDTEENEFGGVITTGMKMALFDVSNPNNPIEMFSEKIGESGTYSELLNNHKALLFSKEKNLIAFPIYITEETEDYISKLKFQGAIVYNFDLENGFVKKGEIAHQKINEDVEDGYYDYDYKKLVKRILYIGNSLFTMSNDLIKSTNIETMEEQGTIEIN